MIVQARRFLLLLGLAMATLLVGCSSSDSLPPILYPVSYTHLDVYKRQALDNDALVAMYAANVSRGRCRAVEREQRFFADTLVCEDPEIFAEVCASENPPTACTLEPRDSASVQQLIQSDVVQPRVLATWNALESIFNREEILLEAAERYPNADVFFKSWLTLDFITSPQSSYPEIAGIRTAIYGLSLIHI